MKVGLVVMAAIPFWLSAVGAQGQSDGQDYPPLALRMRHEGVVHYQAEFGEDGHLINCNITTSSGFAELDTQTCVLLRRRSEAHPQVAGKRDGSMIWRLPSVH